MSRPPAIGLLVLLAIAGCGRIGFDELTPGSGSELAITPTVARTNLNSQVAFAATGGEPPYAFALATGTGELEEATGRFRAPSYPGSATVEVIDATGARASAELSFGGDALYAVGSFINDIASDVVWRSLDGMAWEPVGNLPAARGGGGLLVFDDQLFYAGGGDDPEGTFFDEVWSSPDGITWTEIGRLPAPSHACAAAVLDGRMLLIGCRTQSSAYTTLVWSSSDGASWQTEPPLTVALHGAVSAIVDGAVWVVAGHESSGETSAIWIRLADGSWVDGGDVPVAGEYHGVTVHAGELWVAGGLGLRDRVVTSRDGIAWVDRSRLPISRDFSTLLEWQDALWVIAGIPAQTWRSVGGGPWSIVGAFPVLDSGTAIVQFTPRP